MARAQNPPPLEDRFLQPPGWRWHSFTRNGRRIHFGSVFPEDEKPDAIIVCLPGLSEFSEKYFEVARDCLKRNYAFWVIDWMGQGYSDRYITNSHKRSSYGFQNDIDDLHELIVGYIKHSSVRTDKGRIPLAMLGHSMGGNIGLHYLSQHPGVFECAAFTAPLLGVKALIDIRYPTLTTKLAYWIMGKRYVPGGSDWNALLRDDAAPGMFSFDPVRAALHNAWCLADPKLQVGSPTYGWLYHAHQSCLSLNKPQTLSAIQTPCLIALAGHEAYVDNAAIRAAVDQIPQANLLELPDAAHEILMETDTVRDRFLDAFTALIDKTIIQKPETLKPF